MSNGGCGCSNPISPPTTGCPSGFVVWQYNGTSYDICDNQCASGYIAGTPPTASSLTPMNYCIVQYCVQPKKGGQSADATA